jgi:hypothetical protein
MYRPALRSDVTFSGVGWKTILRLKGDSASNENDPQMFFAGATGILSNLVFQNLYLMITDQRGVSALLLQRQFALRWYETVWRMLRKLRLAMVNEERQPLRGEVEVDETGVGCTQVGLQRKPVRLTGTQKTTNSGPPVVPRPLIRATTAIALGDLDRQYTRW